MAKDRVTGVDMEPSTIIKAAALKETLQTVVMRY